MSPDGSKVFVAGSTRVSTQGGNSSATDYITIAYDTTTGNKIWKTTYDGPAHRDDAATAVAVSPNGSMVFVTGWVSTDQGLPAYATVAYHADTGAKAWASRSGPRPGPYWSSWITVSADGSMVFVAATVGTQASYGITAVAYGAANGSTRWVSHFGDADVISDAAAIAASPDGSAVFVTGDSAGGRANDAGLDFTTVAFDAATGTQLWSRVHDGPEHLIDFASGVAVSPDSSTVVVTGIENGYGSDSHFATVAYGSASGSTLWADRFPGPPGGFDGGEAVAMDPAGAEVFVTGIAQDDCATAAYDLTDGAKTWTRRYDGGSEDICLAIASTPDGSTVFVFGSTDQGEPTYLAAAYDATTGKKLWTKTHRAGDRDSIPTGLAVAPDGAAIFVTGSGYTAPGYDIVTVAYDVGGLRT
jgi:hypothetical protein